MFGRTKKGERLNKYGDCYECGRPLMRWRGRCSCGSDARVRDPAQAVRNLGHLAMEPKDKIWTAPS